MAELEAKESIKAVAVCFACFEGFILKVKRSPALAGWAPVLLAFIYSFASSSAIFKARDFELLNLTRNFDIK